MLSRFWAKISGGDKGKKYPDQQVEYLGRVGDLIVIFPYGMHCDLPDGALMRKLCEEAGIPMTVERPGDVARGEPVFYHPVSGSRIIFKNNGDIDVKAGTATVNIEAATVNVNATTTNLGVGGQPIARVGDSIQVTVPSFGTHVGAIITGGGNTST